jgi:hypothetical protein
MLNKIDLQKKALKEFQELSNQILKQLRSSDYKIPPGYRQWGELSSDIAEEIAGGELINLDCVASYIRHRLALWVIKDAPLYCLSQELIASLTNTNLDNLETILPDLPITLPTFMVLFPKQSIMTPEGNYLECMVIHASQKDKPEDSSGFSKKYPSVDLQYLEHESNLLIDSCSIDSRGFTWFAGINLKANGTISYDKGKNLGTAVMSQEDEDFTNVIRALFIQIILLLTYEPDLISDCDKNDLPTKGRGFSSSKGLGFSVRYPRWLGKNFKSLTENDNSAMNPTGIGTHKSPRTHWRRGHYKKVAIGKNRMDRKVVWIRPILVNQE